MNILVNLTALRSGGGIQVGLDFLFNVKKLGGKHLWYVVGVEGSELIKYARAIPNIAVLRNVEHGLKYRLWSEIIFIPRAMLRHSIDVIYTIFGPRPLGYFKAPSVGGCAYSNLFYPEIDFWRHLGKFERLRRRIIDVIRLWQTRRHDVVIFETDDLAQRARALRKFADGQAICIHPAASSMVTESRVFTSEKGLSDKKFNLILISVYRRNKNIDLIVDALKIAADRGCNDLRLVLTLDPTNPQVTMYLKHIKERGLEKYVKNLGPIAPSKCAEIYAQCDAVVLPSTLESFSNTITEAWVMKKPLLITDMAWSRGICGDAAIYFKHGSAEDLFEKILAIKNDKTLIAQVVTQGLNRLKQFPSSEERFNQILSVLCRTSGTKKPCL